jgi:proteasome lid subunit RPN8/RPN11
MTKKLLDKIMDYAEEHFPREMCGVILSRNRRHEFYPCKNIAEQDDCFIMDPEDYADAEDRGNVVKIVHSHCNINAQPSEADRVACEESGVPWLIVSIPTRTHSELKPTGYKAPLEGRPFSHGIMDCYTIIEDAYDRDLDIQLPKFHRDSRWWKKGGNLYLDNMEKAGFVEVYDMKPWDVILMQLDSPVPNHAAIVLEGNVILHHLQGHPSCKSVYGGFWRKNTRFIYRHKDLL